MIPDNIFGSKGGAGEQKSFEFSEWIVKHGSRKLRVIVIYRPPYSGNHPVTSKVFFEEFSSYLESIVMSSELLLIAGAFNIHVDVPENPDGVCCIELLQSIGLQQHVVTPTHESGHTLDLIITRQCDSLLSSVPVSNYFISDHSSLVCDLTVGKPTLPTKLISYRKIKAIDLQVLCEEMSTSKLCQDSPNSLNDLAECYNLTLALIIDRHAPLLTKKLAIRPLVPWFNNDIKKARRERRKAEIRWRRTRSASHFKEFKARKNHTTRLMTKARCEFLKDFIDRNSFNQKNLFSGYKEALETRSCGSVPTV